MRVRALREFDWGGITYRPGDVLEIKEDHPRLGGLFQARTVIYDATLPSPDDKKPAEITKRKVKSR